MRPAGVVECQIPADSGTGFGHAGIGPQIYLFVFDAPPETLDEDIVAPSPLAINYRQVMQSITERHADFDFTGGQHLDEVGRSELAALIGVEDLGRAVFRQRLFHSFYAEISLKRDRHPPGQDTPCEPVQHSSKVDEPARQWDIGGQHALYRFWLVGLSVCREAFARVVG